MARAEPQTRHTERDRSIEHNRANGISIIVVILTVDSGRRRVNLGSLPSMASESKGWGRAARGVVIKALVLAGGALLLKRLTKSTTRWDHARFVSNSLSGEKALLLLPLPPSPLRFLSGSLDSSLELGVLHLIVFFRLNGILFGSFRGSKLPEILIITST